MGFITKDGRRIFIPDAGDVSNRPRQSGNVQRPTGGLPAPTTEMARVSHPDHLSQSGSPHFEKVEKGFVAAMNHLAANPEPVSLQKKADFAAQKGQTLANVNAKLKEKGFAKVTQLDYGSILPHEMTYTAAVHHDKLGNLQSVINKVPINASPTELEDHIVKTVQYTVGRFLPKPRKSKKITGTQTPKGYLQ